MVRRRQKCKGAHLHTSAALSLDLAQCPALQQSYKILTDFAGKNYYGLTLNWAYEGGPLDVLMPEYVSKAFTEFQYTPQVPQYLSHVSNHPPCGAKAQYASMPDTSCRATSKETKKLQSVASTFLYYSWAVDPTMIIALNEMLRCNQN